MHNENLVIERVYTLHTQDTIDGILPFRIQQYAQCVLSVCRLNVHCFCCCCQSSVFLWQFIKKHNIKPTIHTYKIRVNDSLMQKIGKRFNIHLFAVETYTHRNIEYYVWLDSSSINGDGAVWNKAGEESRVLHELRRASNETGIRCNSIQTTRRSIH